MIATLEQPATGNITIKPESTVSATRLNTWLGCRLRYYFKYVLRLKTPRTAALYVGHTVHAVLKQWNRARWRKEILTPDQLRQAFDQVWVADQQKERVSWAVDEELDERKQGWALLETYFNKSPVPQDERPEGVEVGVEADLSKHGLPKLMFSIANFWSGVKAVPPITQTSVKMPEQFGECLRQAFETSSTDSSRFVLQGAYLDVKERNCHTIVSTNGRALFAANTFKFDLKQSVNLSRQKFLEWSGFWMGECGMAVEPNKNNAGWVKLTTPRWDCIVKQIDGQFPNWRQVVPNDTEDWTKVRLSEAAVKQMLSLSSKLPGDDGENRPVQVRVDKDLYLEGRNKDDKVFTSAQVADVKIKGKPVVTALNREYLQSALRCGLNEIHINTELDPILFLDLGKKMVVMPVRLNGTPTEAPKPTPKPEPTTTPATTPVEERKTEMPKSTIKAEPAQNATPSTSLISQVELIKDNLKNVVRDLNSLVDAVKQAEKDQRATEREVESARATLKKLQQVSI